MFLSPSSHLLFPGKFSGFDSQRLHHRCFLTKKTLISCVKWCLLCKYSMHFFFCELFVFQPKVSGFAWVFFSLLVREEERMEKVKHALDLSGCLHSWVVVPEILSSASSSVVAAHICVVLFHVVLKTQHCLDLHYSALYGQIFLALY